MSIYHLCVCQEWVWPLGFFLRAKLKIAGLLEQKHQGIFYETVNFVKHTLSAHREHIFDSDWKSLPELTNKDGAVSAVYYQRTII